MYKCMVGLHVCIIMHGFTRNINSIIVVAVCSAHGTQNEILKS